MKDLRENLHIIKEEFGVIRRAPISFAFVCVVIIGGVWMLFHFTYASRIDSKDATIQTRESERDKYKGDVERLEKENEKLRQNRQVPDTSLSIKSEALNLAKQLETEISKWPKDDRVHAHSDFPNRFGNWIEQIVSRLDRHGQWSEELNNLTRNFHNLGKEDISNAAKEIRRLANELKD